MPSRRPRVARKPTYHHGNLREALLAAAVDLIAEVGPEAASLREVARRAGVSQAAPYRHFADKAALLAAVAEQGFRTMTAEMRAASAGITDAASHLRATGVAYVLFACGHPAHFRVMFGSARGEGCDPALTAAAQENYALLEAGIAACQRAGVVRDDEPQRIALFAWTVVHGLASLLVDRQLAGPLAGSSARTLAETVLLQSFEGLRPLGRSRSSGGR
ncbi:MAG: TetR/AcrR family transcriptional regulator [Deltaproteobacteria bacterium]|nr:TetR/AcrR family transcriptional regulator [Deltaproteobacteria bacterium]